MVALDQWYRQDRKPEPDPDSFQALWLAVIKQAVKDLMEQGRVRQSAVEFLTSEDCKSMCARFGLSDVLPELQQLAAAPPKPRARRQQRRLLVEFQGGQYTPPKLAKLIGVSESAIRRRVQHGVAPWEPSPRGRKKLGSPLVNGLERTAADDCYPLQARGGNISAYGNE